VDVKARVADQSLVRQRRGQIVAGAVKLFSEQGFYRTTVQQVAQLAGVSPGLIYQYVRDKEDLLLLSILDVLDSYARDIPAALENIEDPLERYATAFHAYCSVVDARRDATVLAYRSTNSLSPERRTAVKGAERETNQLIADCIEACIARGLFRAVDCDLATYQLVMYAHAWALKHWYFSERLDLATYVKQGLDFSLHALLSGKGWDEYQRSPLSRRWA